MELPNITPRPVNGRAITGNGAVRTGFTLLEGLLASVVLTMTVTAMVVPFSVGARNEMHSAQSAIAVSLAQDLMEEILSKPFSDPDDGSQTAGPEPGENGRANFDNIDDYHGLIEPAGFSTSDPLAKYLSREAMVQYVYVHGQSAGEPPKVCRVTVSVKKGNETLIALTRLVYANE